MRSDLRDLASKIETLCVEHIAWPKAQAAVANLLDHLRAMAGHEELLHLICNTERK